MLTNHTNLMVPEHSWDLQHNTGTMAQENGENQEVWCWERGENGDQRPDQTRGRVCSRWAFKIQVTHLFLHYWTSTGQVMIICFPRVEKNDPSWDLLTQDSSNGMQKAEFWFIGLQIAPAGRGWSHLGLFIRTWPHVPGTDRDGMWTAALMWHCHSCWYGLEFAWGMWGFHFSRCSLSSEKGEIPTLYSCFFFISVA